MVPSCVASGIVVVKAKVGARTGMGKGTLFADDRGSLSSRYCTRKVISSSGSIFTIILMHAITIPGFLAIVVVFFIFFFFRLIFDFLVFVFFSLTVFHTFFTRLLLLLLL